MSDNDNKQDHPCECRSEPARATLPPYAPLVEWEDKDAIIRELRAEIARLREDVRWLRQGR